MIQSGISPTPTEAQRTTSTSMDTVPVAQWPLYSLMLPVPVLYLLLWMETVRQTMYLQSKTVCEKHAAHVIDQAMRAPAAVEVDGCMKRSAFALVRRR
jgi:hypothetical protein